MAFTEAIRMNAPNRADATPGPTPSTEPPRIGMGIGHPEYNFVQGLMALQNDLHKIDTAHQVAVTRIEAKIDALTDTMSSTKGKVDDLVRWKFMIVGGAVVAGAIAGGGAWLVSKFGDRISVTNVQPSKQAATVVQQLPQGKQK